MTPLRVLMLQVGVIAACGNLLAAVTVFSGAKDRAAGKALGVLLVLLLMWSLASPLQSIAEFRESYPQTIEFLLLAFFLIPSAVLHTACAWSGREGCGVARGLVLAAYVVGGGISVAQGLGYVELGPVVDRAWGGMRLAHNGVFVVHGVFLLGCIVLGGWWCARAALFATEEREKLRALGWLLLMGTFLPLAVTNYLAVHGIPIVGAGVFGNVLFLIVLGFLFWGWEVLEVERALLQRAGWVAFALVLGWAAVDVTMLGIWGQAADMRWLGVQLLVGVGGVVPFAAYASIHHRRLQHLRLSAAATVSAAPASCQERARAGDAEAASALVGGARRKPAEQICAWLGCQGYAVYRKGAGGRRYVLAGRVGAAARGLPSKIRSPRDLQAYCKRHRSLEEEEAAEGRQPVASLRADVQWMGPGCWVWKYPSVRGQELVLFFTGLKGDTSRVIALKDGLEVFLKTVSPPQAHLPHPKERSDQARANPAGARCGADVAALSAEPPGVPEQEADVWKDPQEAARLKALFPEIVGESPALLRALWQAERLAKGSMPVVLHGETGVGKDLFAKAIHRLSGRKGNFVAFNCGALPQEMAEDTFFGHVAGAFTGAIGPNRGLFVEADGGTLFLDEVDSLPLVIQVKLLRTLDDGLVLPVGAVKPVPVDVRIVVASHRPLAELVEEGAFRADLFFRVAGAAVRIPALREREGDLDRLAQHFLEQLSPSECGGMPPTSFTERALERLRAYHWPGNVRELAAVVRKAGSLARGRQIRWDELQLAFEKTHAKGRDVVRAAAEHFLQKKTSLLQALKELKRELALYALESAQGDVVAAARQLGMRTYNFARLLRSLGIDPK